MSLQPCIVYEDTALVVIDKPCGLPAQGTRKPEQEHVYGILSERYSYVGLHHRLDTPASGLMLLTLDRTVNAAIANAFRNHEIRRFYRVAVVGDPGPAGEWVRPLDGKKAHTRFERITTKAGMSWLGVELETGRTHQIRRHALTAGHPVIGDRRHGGAAGRLWPRLALHAAELEFVHPKTGASLRFTSPLPEDLAGVIPGHPIR